MGCGSDLRQARVTADRWLTILGYPALALLVYICVNPGLLGHLLAANPFSLVFIVVVIAMLCFLALAALLNTWRVVRRVAKRNPTEFGPGWAGPLTHYTKDDEDDLCVLTSDRDVW